jgi:thiol-disulfide isomerase/thioredoxin
MWSASRYFLLGCLMASAVVAAEIGDALPDWSAHELEGQVPDLEGQVVMIDIWASWCAPCKASFPAYGELQREWADQGFVIVAVSVDRKARDYTKFLAQNEPDFATVRDVNQSLVATLSPPAMPTSFIYGRDGRLRAVHEGYRGNRTIEIIRADVLPLLKETP